MARRFEIGKLYYSFTSHKDPKHSDSAVISTHGLKNLIKNTTFTVPAGVTIHFFVPENMFLWSPPTQDLVADSYTPVESIGPGKTCSNYAISKYQGYHNGITGTALWPLGKLKQKVVGPDDDILESYDSIIAALAKQTTTYKNTKKMLKDALEETNQRKADLNQKAADADDGGDVMLDEARLDKMIVDITKQLADNKRPPDIITVRQKVIGNDATLAKCVTELSAIGYKDIYCAFCRGTVVDFLMERNDNRSASARKK